MACWHDVDDVINWAVQELVTRMPMLGTDASSRSYRISGFDARARLCFAKNGLYASQDNWIWDTPMAYVLDVNTCTDRSVSVNRTEICIAHDFVIYDCRAFLTEQRG